MSDPDPFAAFESERTVIKPSAGRGLRPGATEAGAARAPAPPAAHSTTELQPMPEIPGAAGWSPVLQAASSLLIAASRIRVMSQHANPSGLRANLVEAIRSFENSARTLAVPNDQVIAGRYILCTFIDECASSTPWGGSGAWSSQSLLVAFHNEAWGGEKVFQLLGKLAENVNGNRGLLEVIYSVLALGFEGRYRVLQNGRAQLDAVREKLSLMLRESGESANNDLSPHWVGVPKSANRLRDGVPVWVVAVAAALILTFAFLALRFALSAQSNDAFAAMQGLDVKVAALPPPPPPPVAAAAPRLSGFLKPEIEAGLVEVKDLTDKSIITIRGDGFFNPASAEVAQKFLPLLDRIADELQRIPGQVLVTGHTDNQPIRSIRYPSNWHLSQDRAQSVKDILGAKIKADRLRSEGMADTQPISDNQTPAGRAKNRRVEITLKLAQAN
jgi:type VI secretion system protein ImpK